jgi:hypothetical protein
VNVEQRAKLTELFSITLGHAGAILDLLQTIGHRDVKLNTTLRSALGGLMHAADILNIQPDPGPVNGWGYTTLEEKPVLSGRIMSEDRGSLTVAVSCPYCGESHIHSLIAEAAEKGPVFQSAGCVRDASPFLASGYCVQVPAVERTRWANWKRSNTAQEK